MARYRLLQGSHMLSNGYTVKPGEVFESDADILALNTGQINPRFERVDAAATSESKPIAPAHLGEEGVWDPLNEKKLRMYG